MIAAEKAQRAAPTAQTHHEIEILAIGRVRAVTAKTSLDAVVRLAPIQGWTLDGQPVAWRCSGAQPELGDPLPGLYRRNGGAPSSPYTPITEEEMEALLAAPAEVMAMQHVGFGAVPKAHFERAPEWERVAAA